MNIKLFETCQKNSNLNYLPKKDLEITRENSLKKSASTSSIFQELKAEQKIISNNMPQNNQKFGKFINSKNQRNKENYIHVGEKLSLLIIGFPIRKYPENVNKNPANQYKFKKEYENNNPINKEIVLYENNVNQKGNEEYEIDFHYSITEELNVKKFIKDFNRIAANSGIRKTIQKNEACYIN